MAKNDDNNMASAALGVAIGAAAGLAAGFLMAPKSGHDTRKQIKDSMHDTRNKMGRMAHKTKEVIDEGKDAIKNA